MKRLQATGMANERPRTDRAPRTLPTEDKLIIRCARIIRLATSDIRDKLNFGVMYL
jgi:hypothetical protein